MTAVIVLAFVIVAGAGTAVAMTKDPVAQAVTYSGFGLALTLLFVVLQAPDVALSQLAIGGVVVPMMTMLALRAIRRHRRPDPADQTGGEDGS